MPQAAGAVAAAAIAAGVGAGTAATIAANEGTTMGMRAMILGSMEMQWQRVHDRLNKFWQDWEKAQKDMAAQMHAGLIDQTRQIGSIMDATTMGAAQRRIQQASYEARKQYVSTDEGCRFDTRASYSSRASYVGKAVAAGGAAQLQSLGTNKEGSPAQYGAGAALKERMDRYVSTFCDPRSNGGNAPCAGTPSGDPAIPPTPDTPLPGADITPSLTIFGADTIDMANPDVKLSTEELIFNLIDFKVPDPMAQEVLSKNAGIGQRARDRALLAQMDAIGALAWSVVGERSPGQAAPEIKSARQRMGILNASDNPSEYEIRQSVIEELWDPAYYVGLQDTSSATIQKEIFLKAYTLVMMDKLISKMEKISGLYAIQTANMVDGSSTKGTVWAREKQ